MMTSRIYSPQSEERENERMSEYKQNERMKVSCIILYEGKELKCDSFVFSLAEQLLCNVVKS